MIQACRLDFFISLGHPKCDVNGWFSVLFMLAILCFCYIFNLFGAMLFYIIYFRPFTRTPERTTVNRIFKAYRYQNRIFPFSLSTKKKKPKRCSPFLTDPPSAKWSTREERDTAFPFLLFDLPSLIPTRNQSLFFLFPFAERSEKAHGESDVRRFAPPNAP